jgi:hypothetical protein
VAARPSDARRAVDQLQGLPSRVGGQWDLGHSRAQKPWLPVFIEESKMTMGLVEAHHDNQAGLTSLDPPYDRSKPTLQKQSHAAAASRLQKMESHVNA